MRLAEDMQVRTKKSDGREKQRGNQVMCASITSGEAKAAVTYRGMTRYTTCIRDRRAH